MNKMQGTNRWNPTAQGESRRLSSEESGWHLPGYCPALASRTRGGGAGRPNLARQEEIVDVDSSTEEDVAVAVAGEEEEEEQVDATEQPKKPTGTC